MADTQTTKLTTEDFAEQFAARPGFELVRGEVIELSPGGVASHSRPSMNIAFLLESWARKSKSGRVVTNEAGIITACNPDTVRGADVAYFSYQRLPKGQMPDGFSSTAPNIVVEVLRKGQSWGDVTAKVGEYLEMGVDRVWIVDSDERSVHIFRSDSAPMRLVSTDVLEDMNLIAGFACRVSDIFED